MSTLISMLAILLAFLVIPVLLIMVFVRPALLKIQTVKNPAGVITRPKFLFGLLLAWVVCISLGVAAAPKAPNQPIQVHAPADDVAAAPPEAIAEAPKPLVAPTPEAAKPADPASKQDKTFGITPDEFGRRFLAEAKEVGVADTTDWDGHFDIKEGSVNDVFIVIMSDALAMNGTVDKNGELKEISYVMSHTDKGEDAAMNMMLMAGLSARALSPDLPKEATAGVVIELFADVVEQFGKNGEGKAEQVVDGIKYSAMAGNGVGLWLVFEPVE